MEEVGSVAIWNSFFCLEKNFHFRATISSFTVSKTRQMTFGAFSLVVTSWWHIFLAPFSYLPVEIPVTKKSHFSFSLRLWRCLGQQQRLHFKMIFAWKCIKIMFFLKKLFLLAVHQNDLKEHKKIILKKKNQNFWKAQLDCTPKHSLYVISRSQLRHTTQICLGAVCKSAIPILFSCPAVIYVPLLWVPGPALFSNWA